MQGSFSAGIDEITWVLTSYLLANGIMIPMTEDLLALRAQALFPDLGVTFVIPLRPCARRRQLRQMVAVPGAPGLAGAAMVPSSQAIMMETFPPQEQRWRWRPGGWELWPRP